MKQATTKGLSLALLTFITSHSLAAPTGNHQAVTAQTEVAIVALREGSLRLRRGKRISTIRQSTLLNFGDIIDVDNDTRAVIYQTYAPVIRLAARQSRTIIELSPPPPQNALKPEEFSRLKRIYLNARQRRNEPSPVTMGGPENIVLTLIGLRNSAVLEPTFDWTHVNGATRYVINVYDRNEKVIWTANTSDTRLAYPANRPPLVPGDYKWDVTAQVDNNTTGDPAMYDASAFTVISKERTKEIEIDLANARARVASDDGSANLVYISALIEYRRLGQAVAELKLSL